MPDEKIIKKLRKIKKKGKNDWPVEAMWNTKRKKIKTNKHKKGKGRMDRIYRKIWIKFANVISIPQ